MGPFKRSDLKGSLIDHTISGGGNIQLHLVESGNSTGQPILFIHGFSQCCFCWTRQLSSNLADDYRLVAMDIRGHGLSDRPHDAYSDSKLWADDIRAAVHTLNLDRPILCGWSYGPLIILDYIRHYGEDGIRGIVFVGGVTKLGSNEATSVLAPEFLSLVPGFFTNDVEQSLSSLQSLLQLCFARKLSAQELYMMLGYNASVPPHVRQALLSRSIDNDDLLQKICTPVLIAHGAMDAVVKPTAVDQHKSRLAHAEVRMLANAGHAAFWDDAPEFNQHLRQFSKNL